MRDDGTPVSLTLGITALALEFVSLFIFGWLSIIGLILGIIGVSIRTVETAPKVVNAIAIALGIVTFLLYVIAVAISF